MRHYRYPNMQHEGDVASETLFSANDIGRMALANLVIVSGNEKSTEAYMRFIDNFTDYPVSEIATVSNGLRELYVRSLIGRVQKQDQYTYVEQAMLGTVFGRTKALEDKPLAPIQAAQKFSENFSQNDSPEKYINAFWRGVIKLNDRSIKHYR